MKQIMITGATRGLGLAITKRLAHEGYLVIASGRKSTDMLDACMAEHPTQVFFAPYDLSEIEGLHRFVKELIKKHGHFYGLVNNAALGSDGVLATIHNSDISKLLRVNVEAPIVLTKYVSRSMLVAGKGGRIVNISSIIAQTGFSGLSVYGASKAALEGFTRSLARELGRANITVNSVAPGYMQTDMTKDLQGEKLEVIVRRSPFRKLASVDDVAGAVAYLMGPDGAMATGTILTVDAGSTA